MKNELIHRSVYYNLPPILKSITKDFEGREKDVVLLSSLGVVSSCLPNVYGYYDGKEIFANLYVLIIAPPASGKGVMTYARSLVKPIHDKIYSESRQEFENCRTEMKGKKNKDTSDCPPLKVKILPANISSAEMYSYIDSSEHGVLIIESEADTMSNMLRNEWSNYSDVLRKAFHHESLSISRKMDRILLQIDMPKLSIVMSGTSDQIQPLIKSKDNGLFSRFIFYVFNEIADFKNVFLPSLQDYKKDFELASDEIFNLYQSLVTRSKLEFQFTDKQNKKFTREFSKLHSKIKNHHSKSFLSNLNRHALIMFKICMILTVLRNKVENQESVVCNNKDFIVGLNIAKSILKHALFSHTNLAEDILSEADENFLFSLPETFSRQKAQELGEQNFDIPARTVDDKLVQWRKKKAIKKISHGKYKRILK